MLCVALHITATQYHPPLNLVVAVQVLQDQFHVLFAVHLRAVRLECALPVRERLVGEDLGLAVTRPSKQTQCAGLTNGQLVAPSLNSFSGRGTTSFFSTTSSASSFGSSLTSCAEDTSSGVGWTFSRSHSTQLYTQTHPGFSIYTSICEFTQQARSHQLLFNIGNSTL